MLTTILILTANPTGTTSLRLDEEVRDITEGLRRSNNGDTFQIKHQSAVRLRDLQRSLLDTNPQILHFSGHGSGTEGLYFENTQGQPALVSTEALVSLFELFADRLHCVVLNACYSEVQAEAIVQHIPYVIGMNQAIGDRAAIEFAVSFYDALGAGRDVEFAYKLGCNAIQIAGIPEHLTPVLKKNPNRSIESSAIATPVQSVMTPAQKRRIQQKIDGLQPSYDLMTEKLQRLRKALATKADVAVAFQLEKEIEQAESDRESLSQQLELLEGQLQ